MHVSNSHNQTKTIPSPYVKTISLGSAASLLLDSKNPLPSSIETLVIQNSQGEEIDCPMPITMSWASTESNPGDLLSGGVTGPWATQQAVSELSVETV
jgi:hypothetical protein